MSLKFEPIKLQMSVKERSNFTASPSVMINGTKHAIAYNNLLKPGDKLDGIVFGQLVDINGAPWSIRTARRIFATSRIS